MSHLWQHQNGQWQPVALPGPAHALSFTGELLAEEAPAAAAHCRLVASGHTSVLLAAPAARVRVNGVPLSLGCRVLRDRDEIVTGRTRAYFSTERLTRVEAFPGAEGAVFCARCHKPIEPGTPAVRCECGIWCHEKEGLRCWSYAETCPLCPHHTAADAGYNWEPGS